MTGIDKLIIYSYREHVRAIERATAARDAEITRLRKALQDVRPFVEKELEMRLRCYEDDGEPYITEAQSAAAIITDALGPSPEQPQ